jgi:hypothetical protein
MTVMSYLKSSEKEHKGCGVSFMFKIKFVPFHLLSHFLFVFLVSMSICCKTKTFFRKLTKLCITCLLEQ